MTYKHLVLTLTASLALAHSSYAALVTQRTDTDGAAATVNGQIATDEYGPANAYSFTGGGTGFGGQLGPATMYMNSDAVNLYIAFSGLGVPADSNQYIVYFHTHAGGYQPNGEMNDTSDNGRRNTSTLSLNGTESVTYFDGATSNKPDFALTFCNAGTSTGGFSALFELKGAGTNLGVVSHSRAGLGTPTVEFSVPLTSLGVSGSVDVAAFEVSATGFMANEGLPATGLGSNPGFNDGTTNAFPDFHRFTLADFGDVNNPTQRVNATTLRMPQSAPSTVTNTYAASNAFPGVSWTNHVALVAPPGETNRLFVLEQRGYITVITNLAAPTRTLFMDISGRVQFSGSEEGLLALAFHPGYATNGYFYVWYTGSSNSSRHDILARFQTSATNANQGDASSELRLISQLDQADNHNGGDVHFGSDGYLYLSLGDEGGGDDSLNNSQKINSDFFSGIIRIDVDKLPGNLAPNHHAAIVGATNYAIPFDNPFIGFTQFNGSAVNSNTVRTEFYAVGLRNPWRWSFDKVNGRLYCADVGQNNREEIDLITKGGNYGWKWREGFIATPTVGGSPPAGFTNALDPILDYEHGGATNQGSVVIGGFVYRGDRLPELVGRYVFADSGSGNLWTLLYNGTNATEFGRRVANVFGITTFGEDPSNGDILFARSTNIFRVVRSSASTNFPQTLADTGVFADLATLEPNPGIIPFEINVPFWSDNALKSRWFSVPSTNQSITFSREGAWTFPTGMIWIKHFDLLLTNGVTDSVHRLETRILVKNATGNEGYGVTYRWGSSMTNATLVGESGLDEDFVISNGGNITTQTWRYPSRSECLQCHKAAPGFALGFNTPQLNKDRDYNGTATNQIRKLSSLGFFDGSVSNLHTLRALAHPTNTAHGLEYRVRSYLQANCAQCHYPGPANWDARVFTALAQANIVNGGVNNNFGDTNNRVIVPGVTSNSLLLTRISTRGSTQMPPLGSNLADTQSIALITAWITGSLTNYETYAQWQVRHFGSTNNPDAGTDVDFDGDGNANNLEFLTGTDPTNLLVDDAWSFAISVTNGTPQVILDRLANRGFDVQGNTNLLTGTWESLDTPQNAPFFGATDETVVIDDPQTNATEKHYRIRVTAP